MGDDIDFIRCIAFQAPFVSRVALCTTQESTPTESLFAFDTLQFYPWDFIRIPGKNHIQVFRMKDESSLDEIELSLRRQVYPDGLRHSARTPMNAMQLDTYHKDKLGGIGESFNWELAVEAKRKFQIPLILAGGLNPDNVREAIEKVRPYAVDVSSGVESEPGRKDHAKMRAFIEAVKLQ